MKHKNIELHLHLDGSIRPETLLELGVKEGVLDKNIKIDEVEKLSKVSEIDKTLVDYLKKFDLPIKILQKKENLTRVTRELLEDLHRENTIYAEIRFAPILHMANGLTPQEVFEAVLEGTKDSPVKSGIILCAMRHLPVEENMFLLDLAKSYLNKGVVALDLAGDEYNFPVKIYSDFFENASKLGIPYTIHAGEASGAQSVIDAINCGAHRIGHGVNAIKSKEALELIQSKNIPLECCPKSNLDTHVIDDLKDYPLLKFLEMGIKATLNCDNSTVSSTSKSYEVEILKKSTEFTDKDYLQLNINAANCAFTDNKTKERLIEELKGDFNGN